MENKGGTHWTCFYIKDKKSYYFDSFGGNPDKFLLKQLPKPIIYHNFKIQNINSQSMWFLLFILFLFNGTEWIIMIQF